MRRDSLEARANAERGLVLYQRAGKVDAIDQHSRHLVEALTAVGMPARYVPTGFSYPEVRAAEVDWILLQYNPFSFARWGFAPGLVRAALRLRCIHSIRFGIYIHEAWVPMNDWRSTIMGAYQRAQLRSLLQLADTVLVTTERLAVEIGPRSTHVPVASNIVPIAESRRRSREQLGIGSAFVVALFGTSHPSVDTELADAAVRALARRHGSSGLVVLNLGAQAPRSRVGDGIDVRSPGLLAEHELSRHLNASDLLLLPLRDGVSTRRTTLMAGLAHGLPVVALRGEHSDRILVEHPEALRLVAVGDRAGYVGAAVAMSEDELARRATGDAARQLYEQAFAWPLAALRVATELATAIDAAPPRRKWTTTAGAGG